MAAALFHPKVGESCPIRARAFDVGPCWPTATRHVGGDRKSGVCRCAAVEKRGLGGPRHVSSLTLQLILSLLTPKCSQTQNVSHGGHGSCCMHMQCSGGRVGRRRSAEHASRDSGDGSVGSYGLSCLCQLAWGVATPQGEPGARRTFFLAYHDRITRGCASAEPARLMNERGVSESVNRNKSV